MSDAEETADLITKLNAKAIVEAYRAGKEAGQDERNRLREVLERIDAVTFTSGPEYGLTLARIARAALQEAGDELPRNDHLDTSGG